MALSRAEVRPGGFGHMQLPMFRPLLRPPSLKATVRNGQCDPGSVEALPAMARRGWKARFEKNRTSQAPGL